MLDIALELDRVNLDICLDIPKWLLDAQAPRAPHENGGVPAVMWWMGLKEVSQATSKGEEPGITVTMIHQLI